jgi:hypothetical protein
VIVGKHVGFALGGIEMGKAKRWHALHAKEPGGLHPAMPRNNLAIVTDQNRVGEAEPLYALSDLPDLPLGMGPGIAAIRPQAGDDHRLDSQGRRHAKELGIVAFDQVPAGTSRYRI